MLVMFSGINGFNQTNFFMESNEGCLAELTNDILANFQGLKQCVKNIQT